MIVILAICLIGLSANFYLKYAEKKIKQHGKIALAHIISVENHIKPTTPIIKYYYVVNDDTIFYSQFIESIVNFKKLKSLEGKTLSVIYDTTNVQSSKLIINEVDYK